MSFAGNTQVLTVGTLPSDCSFDRGSGIDGLYSFHGSVRALVCCWPIKIRAWLAELHP
jgi:hypothetical protein